MKAVYHDQSRKFSSIYEMAYTHTNKTASRKVKSGFLKVGLLLITATELHLQ